MCSGTVAVPVAISPGYAETKVNVIVTQGGTATVAREATKAKARWFPSDATCCLCMFRFVHLMLAVRRFLEWGSLDSRISRE